MENNRQEENVLVINVIEIILTVLRKWWLILFAMILFGGAGYIYSQTLQQTPMYQTTTKLYVTGVETVVPSAGSFGLGQQVIQNYVEILESRPVIERVIENLELNMTYSELLGCIYESNPPGTCMLEISVSFPDPEWAKYVADELVTVSAAYAMEIIGCTPPKVYDEAYVPTAPHNIVDKSLKYLLFGAVAGAGLVVGLILLKYFLNNKFTTPDKVEEKTKLRVLALIPGRKKADAKYKKASYNHFYSELQYVAEGKKLYGMLSYNAEANVMAFMNHAAQTFMAQGKSVLCLDTNMRNDKNKGEKVAGPTLLEYLQGKIDKSDLIIKEEGKCHRINAGDEFMDAYSLLNGSSFAELLEELKQSYDYVFVHMSPLKYSYNSIPVAKKMEENIVVLSAKRSKVAQVKELLQVMKKENIRLLGVVLKDKSVKKSGKYFIKQYGKYLGVYTK